MPKLGAVAPRPAAQPVEAGRKESSHSGRFLLRMPKTLHADLANAANRAGMSLNQFITNVLAEAIDEGARSARQRDAKAAGTSLAERRGRWLNVLLAVNLVIVAGAGVLAILLLVTSWRG